MNLTEEEFLEIMEEDVNTSWEGDNAFLGLQIVAKYCNKVIGGADHDVIYSADITELIEAGITKEDVEELRSLNWMVEDGDYLACFV